MLDKGIEKIYEEDFEAQKHYLGLTCEKVRSMRPDILFKVKAFYVPNSEYMIKYFGREITHPSYDCYLYDGTCKWVGHLVIPIRDITGKVRGFSGYNPLVTLNNYEDDVLNKMPKYKESADYVMNKSRFFLCPLGLEKAILDKYIIITDGFFDALNVANFNFNSMAILGSNVTKEIKFCLSFIDDIYVAHDNDEAGLKLYNSLKMSLPNVYYIRQSKFKDIDEFIKTYPKQFESQMNNVFNPIKTSFYLKV